MNFFRSTLFVVFVLIFVCSCAADKVVAVVNGERITDVMMRAEMEMERGKYDPAVLADGKNFADFRQKALTKLIQENILLSEAKRLGVKPSRAEIESVQEMGAGEFAEDAPARGIDPKEWEKAQTQRITITKLIKQEVVDKIPVPEEKTADYYKKHAREFDEPAQFRAQQILTDTRETAENVLAKLKQGEDFAELARQYSQSPDAKRGGDLGFFDSRAYPPIFSEVCERLGEGETSGVTATDYGWQIFRLIEKRPARKVPFDEAKETIISILREGEAEGAIEKWVNSLSEKAEVKINQNELEEVRLAKEK